MTEIKRTVRVLMAGQYRSLGSWASSVHYRLKSHGWILKLVIAKNVGEAIQRLEKHEQFDLVHLGQGVSSAAAERMAETCLEGSERRPAFLVSYENTVLMPTFIDRGLLVDVSSTRIDRIVRDRDSGIPDR